MHINLTPEQEQLVKDELTAGHYQTVEQVIGEALQALRERERRSGASVSARTRRQAVRDMLDFVEKSSVRLEDVSIKELIRESCAHT